MITVDVEDSTENIENTFYGLFKSKIPELTEMRVDSLSENKKDDRLFLFSLFERTARSDFFSLIRLGINCLIANSVIHSINDKCDWLIPME